MGKINANFLPQRQHWSRGHLGALVSHTVAIYSNILLLFIVTVTYYIIHWFSACCCCLWSSISQATGMWSLSPGCVAIYSHDSCRKYVVQCCGSRLVAIYSLSPGWVAIYSYESWSTHIPNYHLHVILTADLYKGQGQRLRSKVIINVSKILET